LLLLSSYIFQELVAGGDLHSYLDRKGGALPAIEAAVIVRQLVIALAYLHKNGIAHRDIKPENVLLCSPDVGTRVVLIDFGIASPFDQADPRMLTGAGTEAYIAP
jgi:protein-serine/threonine kinase